MLQMSAGNIAGLSVMWPRDRLARHSCLMSAVTSRVLWPSAIWLSMGTWFAYPGHCDFMREEAREQAQPMSDPGSTKIPDFCKCRGRWTVLRNGNLRMGRSPEPAAVHPTPHQFFSPSPPHVRELNAEW